MIDKHERTVEFLAKEGIEGLRLKQYFCSKGVRTIGVGTTKYPDGRVVKQGDICTKEQAYEWLNDYLKRFVYPSADQYQDKYGFNDNVYVAFCSLAYNIGGSIFDAKKSPNLHGALASKDLNRIGVAFKRFNKVNGIVVQGLVNRRNEEVKLFTEA